MGAQPHLSGVEQTALPVRQKHRQAAVVVDLPGRRLIGFPQGRQYGDAAAGQDAGGPVLWKKPLFGQGPQQRQKLDRKSVV